jgi:hypothetical protein
MAEKKKKESKHQLGPVSRKEVDKAGGSLKEVYRQRAEAGDVGAIETMKRVGQSELERRRKEAGTEGVIPGYHHHRNKILDELDKG